MDQFLALTSIIFLCVAVKPDSIPSDEIKNNLTSSSKQPLLSHFPLPVAGVTTDNVDIALLNTTTSSMGIRWAFKDYSPNGTLQGVFVGYDVKYGKFISNRLQGLDNEFEFKHLQADTSYLVCVEVLEKLQTNDILSHAKCLPFSTIAYIRVDSVLVLLFVIGYLVFMGILGCVLWRRRVKMIGRTTRSRFDSYGHNKNVLRWRDIEERMILNPIEDSAGETT